MREGSEEVGGCRLTVSFVWGQETDLTLHMESGIGVKLKPVHFYQSSAKFRPLHKPTT